MILYLPNDPLARADAPAREQRPRPGPKPGRVGFACEPPVPEAVYPLGSPEFLFWQCREAALAAVETFETLAGPLASWQGGRRLLRLQPSAGPGLRAEYDRAGLAFYSWHTPTKTTLCGASTDAVAHEVGHAVLDALRPDLWQSVETEAAAFHEAFADCLSLLVGLFDRDTRRALLAAGGPRRPGFLEAVAEDIADGVRQQESPQHPHALPRRALNDFAWQLPLRLPARAAPQVLSAEPHSFSRVFTGCFYDTLCNIFASLPDADERALLAAATIAGRLLVAGARDANRVSRFFQAVGRAMVLADEAANGGQHRAAIRAGFGAHAIALGSSVMLAPTTALAGGPIEPGARAGSLRLAAATQRDLLRRMRAPRNARLALRCCEIAGRSVVEAVHPRDVALGPVDRRLRGAIARAAESVLLESAPAGPEVLGALPDPGNTTAEVRHFVAGLVARGALAGDAAKASRPSESPTHGLRRRGAGKRLERVRFVCGVSAP